MRLHALLTGGLILAMALGDPSVAAAAPGGRNGRGRLVTRPLSAPPPWSRVSSFASKLRPSRVGRTPERSGRRRKQHVRSNVAWGGGFTAASVIYGAFIGVPDAFIGAAVF